MMRYREIIELNNERKKLCYMSIDAETGHDIKSGLECITLKNKQTKLKQQRERECSLWCMFLIFF